MKTIIILIVLGILLLHPLIANAQETNWTTSEPKGIFKSKDLVSKI